jgi:lipoprotein-anchoring transpeptidase ErfK/SrfK
MRIGSYLLLVRRDNFSLEIWKRTALSSRYTLKKVNSIAIGAQGFATPRGVYYVQARAKDPDWYVPDELWAGELRGQLIKAGDPRNPIKGAFLRLTEGGVGIHGTDNIASLGSRASHGCIRTHPDVAQDLYRRVRKNTPVIVM